MLLPPNHTLSRKRWRPSQQNPHNLIQQLNDSFWTLGHPPHWSFHTAELSLLSATAQRRKGRVMNCSSCSWGYFYICEEPDSFIVCEVPPHASLLQLQMQKALSRRWPPHRTGYACCGHRWDQAQPEEAVSNCWVLRKMAVRLDSGTQIILSPQSWTSAQVYLSSFRIYSFIFVF